MPNIIFYLILGVIAFLVCKKFKFVPFGMAVITTDDIDFQNPVFADVMDAQLTTKTELLSSGILAPATDQMIKPDSTGTHIIVPGWESIGRGSDRIVSDGDVTLNKFGTFKQRIVFLERQKGWNFEQLTKTITSADATMEIAKQLATFLAVDLQDIALAVRKGAFASASLSASHSTGATYTAAQISEVGVVKAKLKLGDNSSKLDRCMIHSVPHADAVIQRLASNNLNNNVYNSGTLSQILGSVVSVDDGLTPVAGIYPTVFAAPGAIVYKFRKRETSNLTNAALYDIGNNIELELFRTTKGGGQDQVIVRYSLAVHINGMSFNEAVSNPTNEELATGTNWLKVAPEDKQIPIVELLTK